MDPAQQQFSQEWRNYLQQVSDRFTQIMQETEAGCRQLLETHPDDPAATKYALQTLHPKVLELSEEAQKKWPEERARMGGDPDGLGQATRDMGRWIRETWGRAMANWKYQAFRAMWPRVQELTERPVPCTQCGAPLTPEVRHMIDRVTCSDCGAINQTLPDPEVQTFYAEAPYWWAEVSTYDQRIVADRQKSVALDSPAGSEAVLQWERMERDYWTAFVAAKAEILPALPEEQQTEVERMMKLVLKPLSYKDAGHQASGAVAKESSSTDEQLEKPQPDTEVRATVEGVTVEEYAELVAEQLSASPDELERVLAQHGMDMAKVQRVQQGWAVRMIDDPAAGKAYNAAFAAAQQRLAAAGSFDPAKYTFEQYCEILGAYAAWSEQHKDMNAMLQQEFDMTTSDFVALNTVWGAKMSSDPGLSARQGKLVVAAKLKYMAR